MKIALATFFLFLTACTSHHEQKTISQIKVNEIPQDIRLPRNLFKELEKEISDEFKLAAPTYVFFPIQVEFNEKTPDVLKASPLKFEFEKGGGRVDLKEVVSGQGSFFMSFPPEQFLPTQELMHLYFISQSPVKKIAQENFGLGCGKWIDLKNQFAKLQKPEFLKLNTTDQRYLHVLTGHYVFVFKQSNQIYLTQLSITDSRYPKEFCNSFSDGAAL